MKKYAKKFVFAILTLIILIISNLLLSKLLQIPFLELSFMVGLMFTLIIGFFSSEGGLGSEMVDFQIKRFLETEARTNSHFLKFHISIPFIIALIYTIISGIFSIVAYWKYF